jgi:ABC-type spermidine/putrescine transport system permease subunit I
MIDNAMGAVGTSPISNARLSRAAARRDRLLAALGVPAFAMLALLFAYPVLRLMSLSVEGGSLEWYEKALGGRLYLEVYFITVRVAVIVTMITLLLSYPIAYFLATTTRLAAALGFALVILPLWTSILVRTYAWMVLLGRNGIINKSLLAVGFIEEPLALLHNELGVVIGMVHVLMPYMVLPIYAAMRRVDPDLIQAAEGLGAGSVRIFGRIFLPLSAQGIYAGSILVFVLSLGFFITPALLGGGRVIMIAVLIEQQVREVLNWPFAGALSTVLLAATIATYGLAQRAISERASGAA